MENIEINYETPELSEFLNIYPPLVNKANSSETKKYLVYFNRISSKRKSIRQSLQRKNTLSKNNTVENNTFLIDKAIDQQNNGFPRSQDSLQDPLLHLRCCRLSPKALKALPFHNGS